jgi:hypothetical protein
MKALTLVVVVVASSISFAAEDVSGHWTLRMDPDFRGNPGPPVECTFKQKGTDLVVKCGTGSEMKGTVRGRMVTWGYEKTGIPPMTEDRLVVTHNAEINESGTELKGTWRMTSGVMDKSGKVGAKKRR